MRPPLSIISPEGMKKETRFVANGEGIEDIAVVGGDISGESR
jgi:hypothetical protein